MEHKLSKLSFSKEVGIISIFLTLYTLFIGFTQPDFKLGEVSTFYFSQATLDNYSIGSRVSLFSKLALCTAILLPVFYTLLIRFFKVRFFNQDTLTVLSALGIVVLIAHIMGYGSESALHFLFFLLLSILLQYKLASKFNTLKLLKHPEFYVKTLVISFLIHAVIQFVATSNTFVVANSIVFFFLLYIIVNSIFLILKLKTNKFSSNTFKYLVGMSLIPFFIFLSTELFIYNKINYDEIIAYQIIFIALVLLGLIGVVVLMKFNVLKIKSKNIFKYYLVPAALLSFLLLVFYKPIVFQTSEMFELANSANAQMRIFAFNDIPFVDFMSSHMFSEQFYGIIYHLIYGYSGTLDYQSYYFMYEVIFYLIIYYFLLKIFKNPFLSLVIILFFPYLPLLFSKNIFFSIVAFYYIRKALTKQSLVSFVQLAVIVICTILWRLDTGSAVLFAFVFYMPFAVYTEQLKINFKNLFKTKLIVFGTVAMVVVAFSILRSPEYLWANFKSFLHYASANQAHGYTMITKEFNQQFYMLHFLLPFMSVCMILYAAFRIKNKINLANRFSVITIHSSVFLLLVHLANFQRGLVRHSFMESSDGYLLSTFFVGCTLFIISFIPQQKLKWAPIFFIFISFGLMTSLKYFPLSQSTSNSEIYAANNTLNNLEKQFSVSNLKGRIVEDVSLMTNQVIEFKNYLNSNLTKDQTFLDYSNRPMLYYYTQRQVPSYFCQNLQNCIDDYLQLEQINRLESSDVPLTIYSNYPLKWGDYTDYIPNQVRQYILAEYIHEAYIPIGVLNQKSLWVIPEKNRHSIFEKDTLIDQPKTYDYEKSAGLLNNYLNDKKIDKLDCLIGVVYDTIVDYQSYLIQNLADKSSVFIKVKLDSVTPNSKVIIEFYNQDLILGTTTFETYGKQLEYMMPISNHYLWHINKITEIRIKGQNINNVELYKDKRYDN